MPDLSPEQSVSKAILDALRVHMPWLLDDGWHQLQINVRIGRTNVAGMDDAAAGLTLYKMPDNFHVSVAGENDAETKSFLQKHLFGGRLFE